MDLDHQWDPVKKCEELGGSAGESVTSTAARQLEFRGDSTRECSAVHQITLANVALLHLHDGPVRARPLLPLNAEPVHRVFSTSGTCFRCNISHLGQEETLLEPSIGHGL